ncbi:DUF1203 domain-containing protein [Prosthecomicrobium sp. N25]|uniref:DUF1203 domain-containing protein n=1 Tax=Prosthecomicrobium sp. N25 TaxID=3129254 RepID=UPI00307885DC
MSSTAEAVPFRIRGLAPDGFAPVFAMSDGELAAAGALRVVADAPDSFPCRITLADAEVGEELVLLNYTHQPTRSPYGARGPIYVRRRGLELGAALARGTVPAAIARRLLSVRAYDRAGLIVDAEVVEGTELAALAPAWLGREAVDVLHVHFARRGCFAAVVERDPAAHPDGPRG